MEARSSLAQVKSIEVKDGEFPPPEVFPESMRSDVGLGHDCGFTSLLSEKHLLFAFDGRLPLPFDIVSLAQSVNLTEAKMMIQKMEAFFRDFRESGGLFLVREPDRLWNGLHFATWNDSKSEQSYIPGSSTFYRVTPTTYELTAPFQRLWLVFRIALVKIRHYAKHLKCVW
jgi:hypothetical protein